MARRLLWTGRMKPSPPIRKFMSSTPHTIGRDQPLARAHAMMREHRLRHLPVLHGDRLEGIVSDRDLHLIETLRGVDQENTTVEEAMTQEVYTVSPDDPLDQVAAQMAEHRFGSAVVVQHGRVVGVFTATDACRALSELLKANRT